MWTRAHAITFIICGFLIFQFTEKIDKIRKDPRAKKYTFYAPPLVMRNFTFGYSDTFTDTLWIRLIQDFGFCEQDRGGNSFNKDGARRGPDRTPLCSLSWNYHMLNLILELSPKFYTAALEGPLALSTLTDDIDGASLAFDKAAPNYPNDWRINYRAAYHFSLEVGDNAKAARYFQIAGDNGAPDWVLFSAARLNTETGKYELARATLLDYLKMAKDKDPNNTELQKRISAKLAEIEKKRESD